MGEGSEAFLQSGPLVFFTACLHFHYDLLIRHVPVSPRESSVCFTVHLVKKPLLLRADELWVLQDQGTVLHQHPEAESLIDLSLQ